MTDVLARDLLDLEERLRSLLFIVQKAQHGSLTELRRLRSSVLGGRHCQSFLFVDVSPAIDTAIKEAVLGVEVQQATE